MLEELGVNRNLSVQSIMNTYQTYLLSDEEAHAIRGSMDWSGFYVDKACPDVLDPYAICASDAWYGEVVRGFVGLMGGKG